MQVVREKDQTEICKLLRDPRLEIPFINEISTRSYINLLLFFSRISVETMSCSEENAQQ